MYFPRFLVGATAALAVFLIWSYHVTGSIWFSLIWGALAAVVLQLGYFLSIAFLIYRHGAGAASEGSPASETPIVPIERDGIVHWSHWD
ncbi:hypothetical protein C7I87_33065 [Mesorhizobium sp. SARCC-RB16n]|nr:exopolysaccharide production repressor protein [Mesorhizobium sp. SARCC-RB16n]KAA3441943.1 hypothetical protein C7I87_33065 [Mesorhizobium sp. SARCC-RB16n]